MKLQYKVNITCIILCMIILTPIFISDKHIPNKKLNFKEIKLKPKEYNWDLFIKSITLLESNWNDSAIGKTNDVGYLQITPIIVEDCNRIIGYEKYSLNDRFSRDLSIEMFNVIQNNYNKDKDIHFAMKIWNPYAPISYHRKIVKTYKKLINN